MSCSQCTSQQVVERTEIYQECIKDRCVAVLVPVHECLKCGYRWLDAEAEDIIERAFMNC